MRNFKADLQKGLLGQQVFCKLFGNIQHIDGRKGDLRHQDTKIELKSDFYDMSKTKNFFMERYSSIEVLSAGGPWQAAAHECPYFVYMYVKQSAGFVWQTAELLKQLEAVENQLTAVEIKNSKWTTVGYKVERSLLTPMVSFERSFYETDNKAGHELMQAWGFCGSFNARQSG